MAPIRLKYQQPANEKDFEILCLILLQKHWSCPTLELYGRKGEEQHGIDILDVSGADLLRAAQCRLLDPGKTIPPAQIRELVEEAKKFALPLNVYWIMTTAKVSTRAQNEVIRINREHRENGLFELKVMTWDAIEILLHDYPEVRELTYGLAPNESRPGFMRDYRKTELVSEPVLDPRGANPFDAEIEEAGAHLSNRNYQLARLLLQRLRQQKWDLLTLRQKFRVLSNIGAAYIAEGNGKDAIPLFLEAKTYQPDDERALANEVLAYILGDKRERALEVANEARKKYPYSGLILSYWLRTAPVNSTLEQLQREVPSVLESDPDVCMALAERALEAVEFASAERLAQLAIERRPDIAVQNNR